MFCGWPARKRSRTSSITPVKDDTPPPAPVLEGALGAADLWLNCWRRSFRPLHHGCSADTADLRVNSTDDGARSLLRALPELVLRMAPWRALPSRPWARTDKVDAVTDVWRQALHHRLYWLRWSPNALASDLAALPLWRLQRPSLLNPACRRSTSARRGCRYIGLHLEVGPPPRASATALFTDAILMVNPVKAGLVDPSKRSVSVRISSRTDGDCASFLIAGRRLVASAICGFVVRRRR